MRTPICILKIVVVVAFLAAPVLADYTSVTGPGETGIQNLLNNLYGTTFSPSGSNASYFDNSAVGGSICVTRVHDHLASGDAGDPLHLLYGATSLDDTDQVWTDGIAAVRARARFAGYSQHFGWDGGLGTTQANFAANTLFSVSEGYHEGAFTGPLAISGDFRWARANNASGTSNLQWSEVAANTVDGLDHMITYEVTGVAAPDVRTWLIFFDDQIGGGDRDFNDLVVEIQAVPVPGAVLLGALGLGMVGLVKRRFS